LDPSVRVAVADLRGRDLIEPGLVGFENGPPQHLDVLGDRGLVGGGRVGTGEAAQQKAGSGESDCTCNRHITTRDVHRCPPRGWGFKRPDMAEAYSRAAALDKALSCLRWDEPSAHRKRVLRRAVGAGPRYSMQLRLPKP